MANTISISEILKTFEPRQGFGAMGYSLDTITKWLNERVPDMNVRIYVPYFCGITYHDFIVKGKVADVHREVYGVLPDTHLKGKKEDYVNVEDTTTFFYGDKQANRMGTFLPFLSNYDVYFVIEGFILDGEIILNLEKAPSAYSYL